MHIAVDSREAVRKRKTGKGQWTYGFLQELKKRNIKLTLLASSQLKTAWTLLRIKPDLYLSPTSYIIPALIGQWIPCAIVIHDLIAFRKEPHYFKAKCIERLTLRWALKHAMHICTVSEATKRDLLERFPWIDPGKVTVIYAGPSVASPKHPIANTKQYILCIGTLCPRKNQLRLIEAFEQLTLSRRERVRACPEPAEGVRGSEPSLILAGSRGWHDEEIVSKAKNTPGVTWLGHVSDDQYRELIASATVFALPSLYEGFGLSILDAMTMGIPVLTSDRGSLKEVAGTAAIFVDSENVDSIAKGLQKLLTDRHLREELCQRGKEQATVFSWKRTVDMFLEAVRNILEK